MRRRWVWVLAIILAGGLAFIALGFLLPAPAPFDFLTGQKPLELTLRAQDKRQLEAMNAEYSIYSFEANFKALQPRAEKELLSLGFTEATAQEMLTYVKGNPFGLNSGTASTPTSDDNRVVSFIPDTRLSGGDNMPETLPEGNAKGWVTVIVAGERQQGFFDRFRDWLGL